MEMQKPINKFKNYHILPHIVLIEMQLK